MKTQSIITDTQSLISAMSRFGHAIPIYDDGYGPIFIHRHSIGISGIVRARTWEDAYEICEDEFFPDAGMSHEEMVKEFGENYTDDACWQEQFGFRSNAGSNNPIYAKDMNGDSLDILTQQLCDELSITLEIKEEE